jgi:hypothetical protein
MADGSTKQIKNIQLGDDTKGGEVTGVFQFKASDEIHDYKGVTVAGSHFVKEDGRFIMVKDSPLSVKIDKIPVVYSLDTSDRRIFINDIEFADYNGDGVAKNFLTNAGVDLTGFDTEVLRQVEKINIMELKYNEIIGAIVKPDDTVATQAEILEWAAENPMPIEEPKKQNTALLEEVIETFKKRG